LSLASDIDFNTALAFQQRLDQPDAQSENISIQKLIEDGMPEKKKEKKTQDPTEKETEGGA